MTRMICRLPLVASLVLLLNLILSVSAATATADEGTWSTTENVPAFELNLSAMRDARRIKA